MTEYVSSKLDLERYLKGRGHEFMVTPQLIAVRFEVDGKFIVVNILWEPQPGLVRFFSPLPVRIPAARADDVAVAVGEMNSSILAGAFQRFGEGVIFATHAFLDHGGVLSTLVLERCLAMCRTSVAQLGPAVQQVAHPDQRMPS